MKTDHPTRSYRGPGHLMNPNKEKFHEMQRARMFTDWAPPVGAQPSQGKKIVTRRRSVSEEILMNLWNTYLLNGRSGPSERILRARGGFGVLGFWGFGAKNTIKPPRNKNSNDESFHK